MQKKTDAVRRRDLLARLTRVSARVRALEHELGEADNVIRFRLTRHVQSVAEFLFDLDARAIDMPAAHTGDRRQLERDLAFLEREIEFVEHKFEAARAEEEGDLLREARANARAAVAMVSALRSEVGHWRSSRRPPGDGHGGGTSTATHILVAATYTSEREALADYEDVRAVYDHPDVGKTFDAAVLHRYVDGTLHVVQRVEEATRQAAPAGLVGGLAVGALVALFPAVSTGPGLAAGGATGSAIGATAGHVAHGIRRDDLRELGELLDRGQSGLVVVTDPELAGRVTAAISRGEDIVVRPVQIDIGGLKDDIEAT